MAIQPTLGAWPENGGIKFRIWAPKAESLALVLTQGEEQHHHPMAPEENGYHTLFLPEAHPGDLYQYRINDQGPFPDPVSRFQPQGAHGPSQIVDPSKFKWTDDQWSPPPLERLSLYELHVGTFSPNGTFQGVIERLPYLAELGITAIELMPVGDFPGDRNWGYDGVSIYAPARCYGTPDDLRQLVNEAHRHGLAVHLDVVYNHLGPDGNYTGVYSSEYISSLHKTPWGDALNFDDNHSQQVREFFIQNALHWIHEYHIDGLRLDATHAILDDSPRHFLAELTARVKGSTEKPVLLIAEDHRNLASMLLPEKDNGWGLDGVWADDFHHQNRRLLAGDQDGYFRDFRGTTADLATTIKQGWFFTGQHSVHLDENRGTDPMALPLPAFVICIQNHDQIGNRAFGDRLHHQITPEAWRASSTLFLCCPETPLLFMGQEWAATSPFQFFTDHNEDLGPMVTAGRREEFKRFKAFADPQIRETIPDPQAPSTFEQSRLKWSEIDQPAHKGILQLYQSLLKLRNEEPCLQQTDRSCCEVFPLDDNTVLLQRRANDQALLIVARYRNHGEIHLHSHLNGWELDAEPLLSTEEDRFTVDPQPVAIDPNKEKLSFQRPGAVILRGRKK